MSSDNVKDLLNKSNKIIKDIKKKQLLKKLKLKNLKSAKKNFIENNVPKEKPINNPLNLENIANQEETDRLLQRNEIIDNIRSNMEELKKQKFDRINLKSDDESFNNSLNDNSDKVSPMEEESEKSLTVNEPEEKDINEGLEDAGKASKGIEDGDNIAESIGKAAGDVGKVAGSIAGDVGDTLESTAGAITAGGGEFDPIQDIIGGILAIGGAIASGVSVDEKKGPEIPEPIIEQQQSMQGVEV